MNLDGLEPGILLPAFVAGLLVLASQLLLMAQSSQHIRQQYRTLRQGSTTITNTSL